METKQKSLPKFIGVVLALVAIVLTPMFFAACSAQNITKNEAARLAASAALAYTDAHQGYANFADSTYTQTSTDKETETEVEGDITTVTKTESKTTATSSIKNEGKNKTVKLTYVGTETTTTTTTDDTKTGADRVVTEVKVKTTNAEFNLFILTTDNNVVEYYLTEKTKIDVTKDGAAVAAESVDVKKVCQFTGDNAKAIYEGTAAEFLSQSSAIIEQMIEVFYEATVDEDVDATFEKSGNKIISKSTNDRYVVQGNVFSAMQSSSEIAIANNEITGKYDINTDSTGGNNTSISAEVKYTNTATAANTTKQDYTAATMDNILDDLADFLGFGLN